MPCAPVPLGADVVIAQERPRRDGTEVLIDESVQPGKNIRNSAFDFAAGSPLIDAGMNVSRAPRIALLATGSEIATPGTAAGPHQIYDWVTFGLGAMIDNWGGCPLRHAASPDDAAAVSSALAPRPHVKIEEHMF
jgi:molybdopterin molybdotransferase